MVGCDDDFLLGFLIAVFWLKHTTSVAILAPILLATAAVVPILYNILAATVSTFVFFRYHAFSLPSFTYFVSLPKFYPPEPYRDGSMSPFPDRRK